MTEHKRTPKWVGLLLLLTMGLRCSLALADWPTYMKDANRSGISEDQFAPSAGPAWVCNTGNPPSPSFYPQTPAKGFNIGQQTRLGPASTFDCAYAPVVAGGRLYFGSSTDQAIYCLDAASGAKQWTFFAEGAIRFAPVVDQGRVYFGSDDGCVYCLDVATGQQRWRFNAAPEDRRIVANGKVASQWPVRTSVTIRDGKLYFSAGLFPAAGGVRLISLKADTGEVIWSRPASHPSQGYILAGDGTLAVPNGRLAPTEYKSADGSPLLASAFIKGPAGGGFVGMVDDMLVYGPSEFGILSFRISADKEGKQAKANARDPESTQAMQGRIVGIMGWRAAKKGEIIYYLRDSEVLAVPQAAFRKILLDSADNYEDRAGRFGIAHGVQRADDPVAQEELSKSAKWTGKVKEGRSLIIAGDMVVVGGDGMVKGFALADGKERCSYAVDGTAWELATDGGMLFASTNSGRIYCFGEKAKQSGEIRAVAENIFGDPAQSPFTALAELAIKKAGRTKGFCLIAGAGDGRLAYAVAKASEMQVVCVERDPAVAAKARQNLVKAGMYGQVVVHVVESGKLPYVDYFANLVMSEGMIQAGKIDFGGDQVYRVVQPFGGAMVLASAGDLDAAKRSFAAATDWTAEKLGALNVAVHRRGDLPGAGEWTHMFANPQNTDCSGDRLIKGTDYLVQWFGDPSPTEAVGWHQDGMGPLAKGGKLVNIKAFSVECVDAYNGTSQWYKRLPEVTRLNVPREGGSGCLDEMNLYLAVTNDCQVFDLASGKVVATHLGPDEKEDWGYIAVASDTLFGTKQNPKATSLAKSGRRGDANTEFRGMWYASEGDFVVSRSFFALDKKTGALRWKYARPDAAILNTSITIGSTHAYWVESRSPKVVGDGDGSVWLEDFFSEKTFLMAADLKTGKVAWEIPFQSKARTVFYLSYVNGMLIETAPYYVGPMAGKRITTTGGGAKDTVIYYSFRAFDAANGKMKWESGYKSGAGGQIGHQHNFSIAHPVIAGDFIYYCPPEQHFARLSLANGEVKQNTGTRRAKGCATPTGSEYTMFVRSMGIAGIDLASEKQFFVSDVNRPSCWMSILPACGLVLMPEYSFGCMCGFPLQTSIVMAPGKPATAAEGKR